MDDLKKIYIKIGLIILVLAFFNVFALPNLVRGLEEAGNDFNFKENTTESLFKKENYLNSLNGDYSLILSNINELNSSLLASDNIIEFIEFIEKIAKETNNIAEINIPANKKEKQVKVMEFNVTLTGKFSNLMIFLARIENGEYQAVIDSLSISSVGTDRNSSDESSDEDVSEIISSLNIKLYVK